MSVLIAAWEIADSSHRLGTDVHLRLRDFVNQLSDDTEPSQLKTLITPLLAHDKEQQIIFYEIFEKTLEEFLKQNPEENNFQNNSEKKTSENNFFKKNFLWITALVLILLFFFIGKEIREKYLSKIKPSPPPIENPIIVSETIFVNMLDPKEQSFCFDSLEKKILVKRIQRLDEKKFIHARLRMPHRDEKEGKICLYYTPISKGEDTTAFKFTLKNDSSYTRTYYFQTDTFYINQFAKQNTDTIAYKAFQHNPDISSLEPQETWHFGRNYARMNTWKWLTLLISGILIFGATYWYRRRKEKLILNHVPNDKAPYIWSLTFPNVQGLIFNENFYKTISELRRRSDSEVQRMDMARTIKATIKNAGFVKLQYRPQTRPNEYLLLIDSHTPQNHRAQLFNLLYHAFDASEVLIERFYYDGDLRLFWNEKNRRGISLNALQNAYPEHRLIIVGSAVSVLSPTNGKFLRWVNVFDTWRTRALLTPRPVFDWDAREAQLATKFRLLPATLQGIGDLVENLELIEPKDYRLWKKNRDPRADRLAIPENLPDDALLVLLESAFVSYDKGKRNDQLLQWIAACAVPPIPYFDWTLHVASVVDNAGKTLLTLENLFQINRLSWFVDGKMPDNIRIILLDWLGKNHSDVLIAVRKEWQKILETEQNTPPADSVAFEEHRIQILFNEWQLNKKLSQQKFDELEKLLRHNNEALVVEYLRRAPTPLDTFVPPRFRKFVRRDDSFIPKTNWLFDLGWQLPILFLLGMALWLFQPKGLDCTGKTVVYHGKNLCIKNLQDELVLLENIVCDTMRDLKRMNENINGSQQVIDSLIKARNLNKSVFAHNDYDVDMITGLTYIMRNEHLDSSSFYKNIPIAYYNAAAYFYNNKQKDSACIFYNKLNNWAWRDSVVTTQELQKLSSFCNGKLPPGADLANRDTILGIDVSHYDSETSRINWNDMAAAKIRFCYIKATEGFINSDPKFLENVKALSNNKIPFGVYHVFRLMNSDVQSEIKNFLNTEVDARNKENLPPVLDVEPVPVELNNTALLTQNKEAIVARMHIWLDAVEKATGKTPIIHTSKVIWDGILKSPSGFERYPLWVQDYTANATVPNVPTSWKNNFLMWQYTQTGVINKKTGFDTSRFNGSEADFKKFMNTGRSKISAPSTPPTNTPKQQNKTLESNPQNPIPNTQQNPYPTQRPNAPAKIQTKQIGTTKPSIPNTQQNTQYPIPNTQQNTQTKLSTVNPPPSTNQDPFEGQMIFVQGGTFQMGCMETRDSICDDDEKPAHAVTLSSYAIGKYEVTQKQWKAVMGEKNNLADFKGDDLPVEQVSWDDVQVFLQKLNTQTGKKYRLPTEAEWEYAARERGKNVRFGNGKDIADPAEINFNGDKAYRTFYSIAGIVQEKTTPVGSFKPNGLGLYDMSGNVLEWCSDWYGTYETNVGPNPQGAAKGSYHVKRGGGWSYTPQRCRVSFRNGGTPSIHYNYIGFRVILSSLPSSSK